MSDLNLTRLENEWVTLQNQFDSYEKCSLAIKLSAVLLCSLALLALNGEIWVSVIVAILWLQDGIWKTFQNRIGQRLEVIEQVIRLSLQNNNSAELELGMQFNVAWAKSRPNAKRLVIEYVTQSLKPTVAYPHVALMIWVVAHTYVI